MPPQDNQIYIYSLPKVTFHISEGNSILDDWETNIIDLQSIAEYLQDGVTNGTLQIEIDGVMYSATTDGFSISATVICQPGQVSIYGLCGM